jgi:hypothetical protein
VDSCSAGSRPASLGPLVEHSYSSWSHLRADLTLLYYSVSEILYFMGFVCFFSNLMTSEIPLGSGHF